VKGIVQRSAVRPGSERKTRLAGWNAMEGKGFAKVGASEGGRATLFRFTKRPVTAIEDKKRKRIPGC